MPPTTGSPAGSTDVAGAARADGYTGTLDPPRVFISYRRADTEELAATVAERLRQDLGGDQVYRDRDDLIAGTDWREALTEAIDTAHAAVIFIGTEWAGTSDDGDRRIDRPDDVVASECRRVLDPANDCDPIPILIGQSSPPTVGPELEPLFERHAITASSDELVDGDGEAYQRLLIGIWDSVRRRHPRGVLVIGDQDAVAPLDALVDEMKKSKLIDARRLSRFAAGAAVVTPRRLRKGRQRWPDAIIVSADGTPSASLAARIRALEDNPNIRTVSVLGAGVGAGFALGQVLGGAPSTSFTASSGLAPAVPAIGTGPAGAMATAWFGASKLLRAATVGALVAGSGLGVTAASGYFDGSTMAATYGYLDVELSSIRATDDVPETFDPDSGEFVTADVRITNPLTDTDLDVPASIFEMRVDGELVRAVLTDGRAIEVAASNDVEDVLWWQFPNGTDIDDPVIQIREEGGTPLTLPVSDDHVEAVPVEMTGEYETECRRVTFGEGAASLNAVVTSAGAPGPRPNGTDLGRAANGEAFVSFDFTATERCAGGASFFYIRFANYSAIRETRVGSRLVNSGYWLDDNDWTGQINSETVDGVLTMNVPADAAEETLEVVWNAGGDRPTTSSDLAPLRELVENTGN